MGIGAEHPGGRLVAPGHRSHRTSGRGRSPAGGRFAKRSTAPPPRNRDCRRSPRQTRASRPARRAIPIPLLAAENRFRRDDQLAGDLVSAAGTKTTPAALLGRRGQRGVEGGRVVRHAVADGPMVADIELRDRPRLFASRPSLAAGRQSRLRRRCIVDPQRVLSGRGVGWNGEPPRKANFQWIIALDSRGLRCRLPNSEANDGGSLDCNSQFSLPQRAMRAGRAKLKFFASTRTLRGHRRIVLPRQPHQAACD